MWPIPIRTLNWQLSTQECQEKEYCDYTPYLHLNEVTIAEVLKPQGYVSGCFGKWDQAGHSVDRFDPALMPLKQGFDYYFGTPSSNDLHLHWIENETTVQKRAPMATCTQVLTDKTIAFIDRTKTSHFLSTWPTHAPCKARCYAKIQR